MKKVVIAGASGFIGKALVARLGKEYEVVTLSRSGKGKNSLPWDGETVGPWASSLEGAHAIINLSGATINQRWSEEGKKQILQSRVLPTRALGLALERTKERPSVWINGSASGYYGNTRSNLVDESSPAGGGFLAETCVAWEAAQAQFKGIARLVQVRTGVVVGKGGGILGPLVPLTKFFVGGSAGNGKAYLPWIHLDDIVSILLWGMDSDHEGPVNGCQPKPVTNAEFMLALRTVIGRPWAPPAPGFAIRLLEAVAGIPAPLVLEGTRMTTTVLKPEFFAHKDLKAAIKASL